MNLIGLEEIVPYGNLYEYKIFLYDDVIEIGNMDKYVCDLKFIKLEIDSIYKDRGMSNSIGYAIIENLNENIDISLWELEEKIRSFILEEIPLLDVEKRSINVIFSLKK